MRMRAQEILGARRVAPRVVSFVPHADVGRCTHTRTRRALEFAATDELSQNGLFLFAEAHVRKRKRIQNSRIAHDLRITEAQRPLERSVLPITVRYSAYKFTSVRVVLYCTVYIRGNVRSEPCWYAN